MELEGGDGGGEMGVGCAGFLVVWWGGRGKEGGGRGWGEEEGEEGGVGVTGGGACGCHCGWCWWRSDLGCDDAPGCRMKLSNCVARDVRVEQHPEGLRVLRDRHGEDRCGEITSWESMTRRFGQPIGLRKHTYNDNVPLLGAAVGSFLVVAVVLCLQELC